MWISFGLDPFRRLASVRFNAMCTFPFCAQCSLFSMEFFGILDAMGPTLSALLSKFDAPLLTPRTQSSHCLRTEPAPESRSRPSDPMGPDPLDCGFGGPSAFCGSTMGQVDPDLAEASSRGSHRLVWVLSFLWVAGADLPGTPTKTDPPGGRSPAANPLRIP